MSIDLLFFLKKESHDKDFIFQKKRMKSINSKYTVYDKLICFGLLVSFA